MAPLDLLALFRFGIDPLETVVRGTAVYWFLFLLFRFVLRRGAGPIGIADILLLVLVADAAQNAMAGDYKTIADGFLLIGTIALWNGALDWAGFRFHFMRRLIERPAFVLARRGELQLDNLRRERITVSDLLARLREQGIDKLAEVKMARLEGDGDISVIREPSQAGQDADTGRRGHSAALPGA